MRDEFETGVAKERPEVGEAGEGEAEDEREEADGVGRGVVGECGAFEDGECVERDDG